MRLSVYTDYALRLLMCLALKHPESATIGEVAGRLRVSKNHLMKVVYRLGVGGYVQTLRGKSGGLRLARSAAEIVLGDVVRYTESDMALVPCFAPANAACALLPECTLRQALDQALTALLRALDGYTIADLTAKRGPLRALLSMESEPSSQSRAMSSSIESRQRIAGLSNLRRERGRASQRARNARRPRRTAE